MEPRMTPKGMGRPMGAGKGRKMPEGWVSPLKGRPANLGKSLSERFWLKVDKRGPDECWPWIGAKKPDGYGMIYTAEKRNHTQAHIVSLRLHGIEVPNRWATGLTVDHTCNRRDCVNPAHLEVVSFRANWARGTGPMAENARKTHCKHGHDILSPGNYALMPTKTMKGWESVTRLCLTCWPSNWNSPRRIFITA